MDDMYDFKFSNKIIHAATQFISLAEKELGGIGKDKVYAMLDAFDPELRHDIIMKTMLTGYPGFVYITRDYDVHENSMARINAIKYIRAATKLGLKESKDITDRANLGEKVDLKDYTSIELDYDTYTTLERELQGTGYKLG